MIFINVMWVLVGMFFFFSLWCFMVFLLLLLLLLVVELLLLLLCFFGVGVRSGLELWIAGHQSTYQLQVCNFIYIYIYLIKVAKLAAECSMPYRQTIA